MDVARQGGRGTLQVNILRGEALLQTVGLRVPVAGCSVSLCVDGAGGLCDVNAADESSKALVRSIAQRAFRVARVYYNA